MKKHTKFSIALVGSTLLSNAPATQADNPFSPKFQPANDSFLSKLGQGLMIAHSTFSHFKGLRENRAGSSGGTTTPPSTSTGETTTPAGNSTEEDLAKQITDKPELYGYVWDFETDNSTEKDLAKQITDEFEERFSCFKLLNRRDRDRLKSQMNLETEIRGVKDLSPQDKERLLKESSANVFIFGNLRDNYTEGETTIRVTIESLTTGEILAPSPKSVGISPRGKRFDSQHRQEKLGELVKKLCPNETKLDNTLKPVQEIKLNKGNLADRIAKLERPLEQQQEFKSFKVEGDINKFYPIVFGDDAWDIDPLELEINRINIHQDSRFRGSLVSKITYHANGWGNGSSLLYAEIHQTTRFIADYADHGFAGKLIVWLRGGGTTYQWHANHPATLLDYTAVDNKIVMVNDDPETIKLFPHTRIAYESKTQVRADLDKNNVYPWDKQ